MADRKIINPIFVLKNEYFRRIAFFDKKSVGFFLILLLISTIIYSSFPLITQVYVRYLYFEQNIELLINVTILFSILYIIKLLVDIKAEKYKAKYFLKIDKNIKELILKKYCGTIDRLIKKKKNIFTKDVGLYLLLIRTMNNNFVDLVKIVFMSIIIFFFDISLFYYFLISVPFFIIFYVLLKKNQENAPKVRGEGESDFSFLVHKLRGKKKDEVYKEGLRNLELSLEKKIKRKTSHVNLNELLKSFVSFYRLFYLAYFGIYMIVFGLRITNIIVGLLFLTLLIKACNNLLKSVPIYSICSKSFFRINALLSEDDEKK